MARSRRQLQPTSRSADKAALTRAAIYLRRSTDATLQAESLEIQEEILRKYAASANFLIVRIYQESASGRDAYGRDQFLQLIADVTSGNADYEAVLVRDVSRWGRFDNIDESAYYDFLCFRHGVEIIYVEEAFARDVGPYAALQKSMKRVMAADFSREKSRIVTHGKRRSAAQGFRAGAPPPFGMKRILVTPDGAFVQDLPPKAHKLLSCYKTKLAPANNRGTSVVTTIFQLFVTEGLTMSQIARTLTEADEPRPAGGARWYPATVLMVLTNEAYAGVACLWTRGEKGEEDRPIRVEGAYEPVVTPEVYRAASDRLDLMYRAPTTHARLLHESRTALQLWGHLSSDLVSKLAGVQRSTPTEAHERHELLDEAFAIDIAREKNAIRTLLAQDFAIADAGTHLVLNNCFTVAFIIGWTRSDLVHRPIEFVFRACSAHFLICIGCAPIPSFTRELLCSADPTTLGPTPFRLLRSRDPRRSSRLLHVVRSETGLIRRIRRAFFSRDDIAGEAFLRVVEQEPRVVFRQVERTLGWPRALVRRTYDALRAAGAAMPEAKRSTSVAITCSTCGTTRHLTPSDARLRKTDVCGTCTGAVHKLVAVCPLCGAQRLVWPSIAKKMREGLTSPCHTCSLAKGRAMTMARNAALRDDRREKYDLLHHIGLLVFRRMNARPAEYSAPRLWSQRRRRLATLQWRHPRTHVAQTLTINCSFDFVARCRTAKRTEREGAALADAVLDRTRWTAGAKDARGNIRWLINLD